MGHGPVHFDEQKKVNDKMSPIPNFLLLPTLTFKERVNKIFWKYSGVCWHNACSNSFLDMFLKANDLLDRAAFFLTSLLEQTGLSLSSRN